jgi:hypothetical protein
MDFYTQAVSADKREASEKVFEMMLAPKTKGDEGQHPSAPFEFWTVSSCNHKPMILLGLWRGRRGSNPRPLP